MDIEAARRRLDQARAELVEQDQITETDRAPVELDQTSVGRLSRMDAIQRQAMAQAGKQRRQLERRRIDAALDRIDSGDYGYCARCGEAIAPRRLELDPAIATCVGCSSE
ncbi:MAG: TraR/DksA family transcriptional regulator [Phenylobacterium sp.]|uniref:TraR/DksA family transcriptional regulator n=1 Tax=Phenylobacterium sp. TaxID=1871053 RepID=UPI00391AE102